MNMLFLNDTRVPRTNGTATMSTGDQLEVPLLHGAAIGTSTLLLSITGTFGNVLIICAILKTPQLRQRPSNFLLLSLAVADLVATVIAQPFFAVYVLLKTVANRCDRGVDMAYYMTATLSGGSSISHLAAISIDRALATVNPHKHHSIMKKWSKVMLSLCWGTVVIAMIGYFSVQILEAGEIAALLFSILDVIFIGIDFLLMIVSYAIILYRIKFPKYQPAIGAMSSTARERAMEKRVSGTIAIVIFLFSACWFPIVGYRLSHPDTSAHCSFDITHLWIRTLYLANSSMNFIVYSLRIRQFRNAYLRIIARLLQPFRQIGGKCFYATEERHKNITQITVASFSKNTSNSSNEMQGANEAIQI